MDPREVLLTPFRILSVLLNNISILQAEDVLMQSQIIQLPHMKKTDRTKFFRSLQSFIPRQRIAAKVYEVKEESPEKFKQWALAQGIYVYDKKEESK